MLTRILSLILSVVMLTSSIQFDSESVKGFLETFEKVAESFGIELDLGETSALDITNEMIVEPQAYDDFKYSFSRQFTRVKSGCSNSALTKIYMNFSVTASGLHKANADVSNGSTTPLETSESTATHATYNCGTVGTFYHDKNNSNTLTTDTNTATVGFEFNASGSGADTQQVTRHVKVTSNNATYYPTSATEQAISSSLSYTNNDANTGTDDLVTYTFAYIMWANGDGQITAYHTVTMQVQYIQVDTTQLWNLYSGEASLNRSSANYDSSTWSDYQNALTNAANILAGGVDQTTINNAYTNLVNAVKALKVKINYNTNGATSGSVTTPQYYTLYSDVSASATSISEPLYNYATATLEAYSGLTKTGYACTGWSTSSTATAGSSTYTMTAANATSAITLYAAWSPITYTVKYNANPPTGSTSTGSVANQTCSYGTTYTVQANSFVVSSYKFVGWNTNAAGTGTTYQPGASFNNLSLTNGATVDLYAMWEPDTVDITLNRNRSKDGIEIEVLTGPTVTKAYAFTIGSVVDLTQYKMTAVGYNHIGWATSATATAPDFTTSFTVPNTAQTLHAVWQKKSINVAYTLYDGVLSGSGYTAPNAAVQYNGTVDLPNADQITRTGCVFTGWHASVADANGKTFFEPGVNYVVPNAEGTITFTANWELRTTTYTFHHNNNASSDYTTTLSGQYNSAISSEFPTPTAMTGYSFSGWYEKIGDIYVPYTKTANFPADDIDLYAGWSMDALAFEIGRFPSDIDDQATYPSTGELKYYYQEPGRTNAKNELVEANAVYTANDGVLYDYTKITETNTATTELKTAIDVLVETPADYFYVNDYLTRYDELIAGTHNYQGYENISKDHFTEDSFLDFENATDIFKTLGIKNQETVNGYVATLETAYNNLVPLDADYTEFNWYMEEALTLNTIIETGDTSLEEFYYDTWGILWYEEGSWYAFFDYAMIYNAELPRDLSILEQEMIDNIVLEIKDVYDQMQLNPADYSEYYNSDYATQSSDIYNQDRVYQDAYREAVNEANNAIIDAQNAGIYTYRYDQATVDAMIQELADLLADPQYKSYKLTFMRNDGTDAIVDSKWVSCEDYLTVDHAPENPTREGYLFLGWYTIPEDTADERGTKIDFTNFNEKMGTADRIYYARWSSAYTLDVSAVGGYVYITLGDMPETLYEYRYTNDNVVYGTVVRLRAVSDGAEREFLYWKDNRHRIVSYSETIDFTLEADRYLTAVYSEPSDSGYYTVVFVDSVLKTVLDEQQVAANGTATAPEYEQTHGEYTFDKWSKTFDNVTGNIIVEAVYVLGEDLFTITMNINGTVTEETYRYNAPVTLTITDEQIPEGKVFAGWSLDGETIASYDRTYKFYAYKDMTVTAIFSETTVKAEAIITLETAVKDATSTTYNAEFMVTRTIPDSYVFISSGLLLTQSSAFGTNEILTFETQSANTNTIRLYRTVHTENNGQYQLTVKTSAGKTFYARGFVVYLDTETGELVTLYTDVESVTN